jgi:hypothetical protein
MKNENIRFNINLRPNGGALSRKNLDVQAPEQICSSFRYSCLPLQRKQSTKLRKKSQVKNSTTITVVVDSTLWGEFVTEWGFWCLYCHLTIKSRYIVTRSRHHWLDFRTTACNRNANRSVFEVKIIQRLHSFKVKIVAHGLTGNPPSSKRCLSLPGELSPRAAFPLEFSHLQTADSILIYDMQQTDLLCQHLTALRLSKTLIVTLLHSLDHGSPHFAVLRWSARWFLIFAKIT